LQEESTALSQLKNGKAEGTKRGETLFVKRRAFCSKGSNYGGKEDTDSRKGASGGRKNFKNRGGATVFEN